MVRQLLFWLRQSEGIFPVCRGILFDLGRQFNENLDNGKDSKPWIDIYMAVLLIPVIGANGNGAAGNQRAVLFTGKENGDDTPGLCLAENRQIAPGISMAVMMKRTASLLISCMSPFNRRCHSTRIQG